MEMECFKAGDEKTAALRLLKHLESYITHKDAPRWIKDFQALIQPEVIEGGDADKSVSQ